MNTDNTNTHPLYPLGWNTYFQNQFDAVDNPEGSPARITGVRKNHFLIRSDVEKFLSTGS